MDIKRGLWNALSYTVLLVITAFSVGPVAWMFITSFKTEADVVTPILQYLPHHPTISNYRMIWEQSALLALMGNSVMVTLSTVAICLTAGTLAAYALSRMSFVGRQNILFGLLATRMFPVVLMIGPLFIVLQSLGLADTKSGLALAYAGFLLPMFIWILKSFFDSVPRDMDDAARLDGASPIVVMTHIIVPLSLQGIAAATFFTAIAAWNEFLFALMFTTNQDSRTWPVGLQLMVGDFQLPWGKLAAGGMLSMLPVLLLFFIGRRVLFSAVAVEVGQR